LNRFDRDRSLTVMMYRERKDSGVPWDDNVHSLRGLEEALFQKKDEKSRQAKRSEHVKAVLSEQERLESEACREELALAAKTIRKHEKELAAELLRGVSCSLSKADKQRALGLALKDEKASSCSSKGSARKLLSKVKSKLYVWASTSNKSLGVDADDK
jgi:hypothetical protein